MNTASNHNEQRRAPRKSVNATVTVMDVIRDQPLGYLGNLSATGMLLIGQHPPTPDAVYQVRLNLPMAGVPTPTIEVGIQAQWHQPAARPGQVWAGYRIIAIAQDDAARLSQWLRLA
ncbi:PilZ domain-containing protein [Dyella sp. A6]|uniref:PilZ domain-containing protein n=1 Tax=Dyella aluminiiresistens TaxID=3069105 RepID=UPI002E76EE36|nr:PilZ domain-containing protein [Dyella sp. A6]